MNRGLFWPFTGPGRYGSGRLGVSAGTGQGGLSPWGSGQAAARRRVPKTASIGFSTDAFHAGQDSYSPVSLVYFDRAPFKFTGKITTFYVKYQCPDLSMKFNAAEIGKKEVGSDWGSGCQSDPYFPPSPISLLFPYAKSGDAATISGYFGKGDSFGQALGEFSPAHADHTEQNHAALVRRYAPGDWRL